MILRRANCRKASLAMLGSYQDTTFDFQQPVLRTHCVLDANNWLSQDRH